MKEIKVVIGANFGDEGKGLMTDYFCESLGGRVLNVRFNATSQAGHTVERDGKRHVFSHFGAGSMLPGVATYLSSDFYFNPISFFKELEELQKENIEPEIYICEKSRGITIYDIFFNCILEDLRGNERHGSCGAGLWETVNREWDGYIIEACEMNQSREELRAKLEKIRDEYYPKRFANMGVVFDQENEWYEIWYSEQALENYLDMFYQMKDIIILANERDILNSWSKQVYEGAQGLLLDYDNKEYMPNLTASYTGSKNVVKLVNQLEGDVNTEICYITRTYFTRHGAGRFETETAKENLDRRAATELVEETNVTNRWQGGFRWGYFDKELFLRTINKDDNWLGDCKYKKISKSVAFTHLNITGGELILPNENVSVEDFVKYLPDKFVRYYCSSGKTAKEVENRQINAVLSN